MIYIPRQIPGDGDAGLDDHNGDGDADDHDGGSCDGVDGCIEEDTFGLFKLLTAIFLPTFLSQKSSQEIW